MYHPGYAESRYFDAQRDNPAVDGEIDDANAALVPIQADVRTNAAILIKSLEDAKHHHLTAVGPHSVDDIIDCLTDAMEADLRADADLVEAKA